METWTTLLISIGFIIFVVGIALVIIGIILATVRRGSQERQREKEGKRQSRRRVRGAGVVVIGPIPIVFGTDRGALLVALVTTIALMIFYLLLLSSS